MQNTLTDRTLIVVVLLRVWLGWMRNVRWRWRRDADSEMAPTVHTDQGHPRS